MASVDADTGKAWVLDLHADTPTRSLERPDFRLAQRNATGHVDLPRLREGGVDGIFFVAWVEPHYMGEGGGAFRRAVTVLERTREAVEGTEGMRLARSLEQLGAAREAGDVAVFLAVEGGHALEGSPQRLESFRSLGVRYLTLTWNHATTWADACCSPPLHGGLTDRGREIVRAMEEVGIVPDLSHAADTTVRDVLEVVRGPVLVSHSCARALVDHPRNLPDDLVREVARAGGVIGVNFFPGFADASFAARIRVPSGLEAHDERDDGSTPDEAEFRRQREALDASLGALPRPPFGCVLDHIEHLVEVAGVEHVALGSDFDGVSALPAGLDHVGHLPRIGRGLRDRGMREEDVRKILGGNVMALLQAVGA